MRAQASSIDLILSAIVLSMLAFFLVSFLATEAQNAEIRLMDQRRDRLALSAISQLIMTPGQPENWDSSTCKRLGLSCGEGILCPDKVSKLNSLYFSNYNLTRSLTNLQAYDISILVCSASNYSSCRYNMTTAARELDRHSSPHVSRAEMVSLLDGEIVSVILYVWE